MSERHEPVHIPVMMDEVLQLVETYEPRRVLDGTVGLGGHARAILDRVPGVECYIGLDRDPEALAIARERLARHGDRVELVHASFDEAGAVLAQHPTGGVDMILLDLGVSSMQLDSPDRGFSFSQAGPVDMRMDPGARTTALDVIQQHTERELKAILKDFGEVPVPGRIARVLKENQDQLTDTQAMARIVAAVVPGKLKRRHIHPATLVFQGLRIAVNRELEILEDALPRMEALLSPAGLMAVISFHSLEDRRVKRFFLDRCRGCDCPRSLPKCVCGKVPTMEAILRRPSRPTDGEIANNPRSRSARLRAARRVTWDADEVQAA